MRNVSAPYYRADLGTALRTLEVDWLYRPSAPNLRVRVSRLARRTQRRPAPSWHSLMAVTPAPLWIAYFLFLPTGQISEVHRYTIARLRSEAGAKLLLIVASPEPTIVPKELCSKADALYWKALSGFDFSAFAIAIHEVASRSPGAEVILLNDSVFGPFASLRTLFDSLPWDVAALTANAEIENHIQSYCWRARGVTPEFAAGLARVLSSDWAYDRFVDVVTLQETKLARCVSAYASVGAKWFCNSGLPSIELTTSAPIEMIEMGLPLMKRSLLGKFGDLHPRQPLLDILRRFDHPLPGRVP